MQEFLQACERGDVGTDASAESTDGSDGVAGDTTNFADDATPALPGPFVNHNEHITHWLDVVQQAYAASPVKSMPCECVLLLSLHRCTVERKGKAYAYRKAIMFLKMHPRAIHSVAEAAEVPGIGPRILEKIREILTTGRLERADSLTDDPRRSALADFQRIWGVSAYFSCDCR